MKEKMKKLGAILFIIIYFPIVFVLLNIILPVLFIIVTPFDNLQIVIRRRKMTNQQKAEGWYRDYNKSCKIISESEKYKIGKYSLVNVCNNFDKKLNHKVYLHYLKKANAEA